MSAKTGAARRDAFFRALEETGNRTVSAERVRVSQSWVSLHRASDPAFKARMEASIATAGARLRSAVSNSPPAGWSSSGGEELVVRGTNGRRVQIARARLKQWTPSAEAAFLRTLAATCNVKAAAHAAGLSVASAYNRRNQWLSFDERWRKALEAGYVRLEMGLIEAACNTFSPAEIEPDAPIPPMTATEAIHLLNMHKHEVRGIGRRPGHVARPPDIETVYAEILRLADAIARAGASDETGAGDLRPVAAHG